MHVGFALQGSTNGRGTTQFFKTYPGISKVLVYPSTSFQLENIIFVGSMRGRGQVIIVISFSENIQISLKKMLCEFKSKYPTSPRHWRTNF